MRCTGHCCENFYFPKSRTQIREEIEFIKENGISHWEDGIKITEMLIHIESTDSMRHYYTCKHYDKENKLCTDYANRPKMCSEFPYGQKCPYTECTMVTNEIKGSIQVSK